MSMKAKLVFWRQEARWLAVQLWRRRRPWVLFACFALIAVGGSAWWNTVQNKVGIWAVLSTAAVNLSVSLLAAAFIDLLAVTRALIQVHRVQRQFQLLLGITDDRKQVALVVPKAKASIEGVWEKQANTMKDTRLIQSIKGPYRSIDVAVGEDLVAATNIVAAFSEIGLEPPTILWDDEAEKEIARSDSRYQVFVSIGLFSNDLTVNIANNQPNVERFFRLEVSTDQVVPSKLDDFTFSIRLANYTDRALNRTLESWNKFSLKSDEADWGLISKVIVPLGKIIYVIGGIEADGTEAVGTFFREHWRDMLHWRDDVSHRTVGDLPFAVLLEIPIGTESEIGRRKEVRVPGSTGPSGLAGFVSTLSP